MPRNLILACFVMLSSMAYSSEEKDNLKNLKLFYPNSKRTVLISLEYANSQMTKIDYVVDNSETKVVSKKIDANQSRELMSMWKKNGPAVLKAKTEIGCDKSQMWVVEFQSSEKKVFCKNKEAVESVAKFQKSIQFFLLDLH